MYDVIGHVIPFFGLILAGFVVARLTRQPLEALGWMNTFIIYLALPALFFQLLSKTPIEQLTAWGYIFGAVFAPFTIFSTMFGGSQILSHEGIAASTMSPCRCLWQYRLHGTGYRLAGVGRRSRCSGLRWCTASKTSCTSLERL
jgi:hypothetical protein